MIDDNVFAYDEERGISYETFVVQTDFDPAQVIAALTGPGERLMLVGEDGREFPDWNAYDESLRAGEDIYTPNYMSEPHLSDAGVEVYLDCKGAIEEPMARALRRVLHEVLAGAVPQARVRAVVQD